MENDIKEKEINEDNLGLNENVFGIEYIGQNLKKNEKFLNWKNIMLEKLGNEAKLFFCKNDKIYFYGYVSSSFTSICPICGFNICYFCSKIYNNCCIKRKIYENVKKYSLEKDLCSEAIIAYFIPYLNSIYIMLTISYFFLREEIDKHYHYFFILYLMAIILSIPYFFTVIIFLIFLFIISIPFNFLPFKVFAGLMDEILPFCEMFACCLYCCFDLDED